VSSDKRISFFLAIEKSPFRFGKRISYFCIFIPF